MRSTALTAVFFALFALFSAVAHAAPAAPQGAVSKRQSQCVAVECRIETNSTSSPGSTTGDAAPVIYNAITNLLGLLSNTPGAPQPTAATASESSSALMTQPTGV
ncbi:hypothetical protein BJV77DRAFT_1146970 [Russula vinacea]|nr:hypothetical protein BJV77DRAFT_1146970 [Russula vinacea]